MTPDLISTVAPSLLGLGVAAPAVHSNEVDVIEPESTTQVTPSILTCNGEANPVPVKVTTSPPVMEMNLGEILEITGVLSYLYSTYGTIGDYGV